MKYICQETDIKIDEQSVVVLGNFDGVHKGHQKLFTTALNKAKAQGRVAIALSFYPHPTWVLGHHPKPLIMSRRDRKNKVMSSGMDVFIEYPFTKAFARISPETFFKEVLVDKLNAKVVVVGSNYFFGKDKKGDVSYLRTLGEKYNVEICAVDTVQEDGCVISSTHIRQLIIEGKMEKANELLDHPYTIVGTVVHGRKLGRTIGFPTINLIADPDRVYPPNGVYATKVKVYNQYYVGITNVGYNPTVGNTIKMIETHICDFESTLYGEEVEVAFYHFIRAEKKFNNIEELSAQINQDRVSAQFLFSQES